MKHIYITLFIVLILSKFTLLGQTESSNHYYIEPIYQYGFIWKHRPSLSDIVGGNINVARITFGKSTYGKNYWEQLYRYPNEGLGYSFTDLGNNKDLGQAHAIYAYFRIPIIKRTKFSLSYKISGGLAYLNRGNIAIGSHLNLYFDFSLDTKFKLTNRLDLINSFGATHYSNGAIVMPNLGINLFSYRIGVQYKLYEPDYKELIAPVPTIYDKNLLTLVLGVGIKEKRPKVGIANPIMDGTKYTVASFSLDYMRILSHKHKAGIGLDVFYDETMYKLIDAESTMNLKNHQIMRYGIHLAGEARYKQLVLAVHCGTYIWAKYKDDGKLYQRVALRYLLTENLFANISLKTSNGVADFVEWGLGYQFAIKAHSENAESNEQ